ncbi:uncharacterized protein LOC135849486 [Planococcus citri]|uniref:uncharacterized protein LOC135849486 n=1 Tax=Planococcus citri TaxID=170843 RepID=UPI0031F8469E
MSQYKFDFSGIKLIKMPNQKKKVATKTKKSTKTKKFEKPKFQEPAPVKPIIEPKSKTPEVVTLSDSEDSKDPVLVINDSADIISILESSSSEDECETENPSVEVITLDDSDSFCNNKPNMPAPDYIPIPDYLTKNLCVNQKKRKKKQISPDAGTKRRKKKQLKNDDVVIVSDGRKTKEKFTPILKLAQSNILVGDKKTTGLRPVVIDGPNVAHGYGNGCFDIQGVILVIQYFIKRGHTEITCFLPAHYRHRGRTPEESHILEVYEKDGIISYTPSRKLFGKYITPYDDRFIVQYASELGGVIISNDGYRDICEEEPAWLETVQNRLINYTFVKNTFMLPKDPLGRNGPSLDDILKFS